MTDTMNDRGRVVKFRGWDGEKMHYPAVCEIGVNGWNGRQSISFPANGGGMLTTDKFMQFTGLLDRKGVEIFEGDVIEHFVGDSRIGLASVVFGEYRVMDDDWGLTHTCQGFFLRWVREPDSYCSLTGEYSVNVVIGNIYENPELLKGNTP